MVKYGLTLENVKSITEKAKYKKDGVYDFRGVTYAVKDQRAAFYADGDVVIQPCYGFLVEIGKIAYGERKKDVLKDLLKRSSPAYRG